LTFQENKRFTVKDEEEWIKNKIKDKHSDTIVVLYNGEPAGIGELQFKKTHAVIGLWVRKKFLGKGLCMKLVKKLLDMAKEKGFSRVELSVDEQNIAARKCYESIGFEYTGFKENTVNYLGSWRNEF